MKVQVFSLLTCCVGGGGGNMKQGLFVKFAVHFPEFERIAGLRCAKDSFPKHWGRSGTSDPTGCSPIAELGLQF